MVRVIIAFIALVCLEACSALLPYHENKLCERGTRRGVCGRVSAVYEDTIQNPHRYKDVPPCKKEYLYEE